MPSVPAVTVSFVDSVAREIAGVQQSGGSGCTAAGFVVESPIRVFCQRPKPPTWFPYYKKKI
jgi:hypothetical protein